jgi:heat shock protein HslJ
MNDLPMEAPMTDRIPEPIGAPSARERILVSLLVMLATALLPAGCGSTRPDTTMPDLSPTGVEDSSLAGTRWVLTELRGEPPLGSADITLVVDEASAGGWSGCNHYGGAPAVTDDSFRLDDIVATAMACEDARLMDQESDYLSLLGQTSTWEIDGSTLTLRTSGVTFVFREATD